MSDLDKLVNHLTNLDKGTSPRRAKATEFAKFTERSGKRQVRLKLQGLQSSALGSFDEADAKMLEALWDNRAEIIEGLELATAPNSDWALLHGPGDHPPLLSDLAKSPVRYDRSEVAIHQSLGLVNITPLTHDERNFLLSMKEVPTRD